MATRIKEAAAAAGYKNVGKLAEDIGLSRQTGYGWIRAESPSEPDDDNLDAISRKTGKSVGWLRGEIDSPLASTPPDYRLMIKIWRALDEELARAGLSLSDIPEDRMERIVRRVHDASIVRGSVDRDLAHDLISLLA